MVQFAVKFEFFRNYTLYVLNSVHDTAESEYKNYAGYWLVLKWQCHEIFDPESEYKNDAGYWLVLKWQCHEIFDPYFFA